MHCECGFGEIDSLFPNQPKKNTSLRVGVAQLGAPVEMHVVCPIEAEDAVDHGAMEVVDRTSNGTKGAKVALSRAAGQGRVR